MNPAEGTFRALIEHRGAKSPEQTFLIDPTSNTSLNYADLVQSCRAFALYLNAQGCRPGESIGYAMHNGLDTARVILGCLYGGFLTTAINLAAGKTIITHVLEHAEVKAVLVQPTTRELIESAIQDSSQQPVLLEFPATATSPLLAPPAQGNADDTIFLMYTSGTTGLPKGVVHTHQSLLAGGRNTALAHRLSEQDRGLCVLPLYHINGLCVSLLGALVSGGSLVMPKRFSVSEFWPQLARYHCSWFSVVPTQISYLLHQNDNRYPTSNTLRFGRSASSALAPGVQEAFEKRFGIPIIETMGLTETAAQILANPLNGTRKIGSPGIAFGNEVMIADSAQRTCPPKVEGEILVRGDNVMREYRRNPSATNEALTPDGWLRTGDLGYRDHDGYVFVSGRLKELIIKGGENIAPREIDEALYSHPEVIEAAAFGRPCTQYGERVEAGVMLDAESNLTAEALIAHCIEKIGRFKAPSAVYILPELPKGPSGKIQRRKVAEQTQS